jgi:hypothetical protein
MRRSLLAFTVALIFLSCATASREPPLDSPREVPGFPLPTFPGLPDASRQRAADALAGALEPGDRVISVDRPRQNLLVAHVQNGSRRRQVRLEMREGFWNVVSSEGQAP